MSQIRVESFTISIDGYGAGPSQSLQNPLGSSTFPRPTLLTSSFLGGKSAVTPNPSLKRTPPARGFATMPGRRLA